ncbi:RNase H-fold protein (predicted Holliday junction resolvase) [Siphonobacter sp. SORGH_AS 1065]|nr:RNase H-fold protein (predicted Holliday junction resolvase) [Siphonobacter sp. SORGH_AS_1065]
MHEHDERFTSVMAMQSLIAMGTTKKDRRDKGVIDRVSATIILQSFLASRP